MYSMNLVIRYSLFHILKAELRELVSKNIDTAEQLALSGKVTIPRGRLVEIIAFLQKLEKEGGWKAALSLRLVEKVVENETFLKRLGVFVE